MPSTNSKPRSLYRRRHHFNERLSQWLVTVQRVPKWVVDAVKVEVHGVQNLTKTHLRAALRKLKLAKHIEHWVEIYCCVTNRPYPTIDGEVLEKIRNQFLAIENAFEKHKPPNRKCI